MGWPMSQDYNEAIQSPARHFADPDLRRGEVTTNAFGIPQPCSGNFADVYQVRCPDGTCWAVKCFTRRVPDLHERYREISRHLSRAQLPFIVDFTYLDEGIRVDGRWFPVVKMQWVEGLTLNEFVTRYAHRPRILEALLLIWARMGKSLRAAEAAHGDLQHGNVLLVPGATVKSLALKLVDYDGMWVPALARCPSIEVGHPAYQHPQRLRYQVYGPAVDCFPLLLVATALNALKAKGPALWEPYDNGDNLLFRRQDLEEPAKSPLFRELLQLDDSAVRHLAAKLREAAETPLDQTPLLEDALFEGNWEQMLERQRGELLPWLAEVAPEAPVSCPVVSDRGEAAATSPPRASHPAAVTAEEMAEKWVESVLCSSPPPRSNPDDTVLAAGTAAPAATKPWYVGESLPPMSGPAGSPSEGAKGEGKQGPRAVWRGGTAGIVALLVGVGVGVLVLHIVAVVADQNSFIKIRPIAPPSNQSTKPPVVPGPPPGPVNPPVKGGGAGAGGERSGPGNQPGFPGPGPQPKPPPVQPPGVNERGNRKGHEPPKKPEAGPKPKNRPDEAEKVAARKLKLAKQLIEDGSIEGAKDALEEILKKFKDTEAATEAKQLLDKLNK